MCGCRLFVGEEEWVVVAVWGRLVCACWHGHSNTAASWVMEHHQRCWLLSHGGPAVGTALHAPFSKRSVSKGRGLLDPGGRSAWDIL